MRRGPNRSAAFLNGVEGASILSGSDSIAKQLSFFSQVSFDGPAVQKRFSEARVLVIGCGDVADHAANGLTASGIEQLRRLEDDPGDPCDAACVLVCLDKPNANLLHAVNSRALREGWNWIPGQIASGVGIIGPAVIPRQSACYTCYTLRRDANLPPEFPLPGDNGAVGPLAACVGSLMAMEAVRLISGMVFPQTIGNVLKLDFLAAAMTLHRVLRLPNCTDCGYGERRLPQLARQSG